MHGDVRADNVLLTADGVVFVDWPHAAVGTPVFDVIGWAPSVVLEGGPPPEELLARHVAPGVDPDVITVLLAAVGGFFVSARSARRPRAADHPSLPGGPGCGGAGLAPPAHRLVTPPQAAAARAGRFGRMRFGLQIPNFTAGDAPGASSTASSRWRRRRRTPASTRCG